MNMLCMGGRTVGPEVAWDLVQAYLQAKYSQTKRHLRRLGKVTDLENIPTSERRSDSPHGETPRRDELVKFNSVVL